MAIYARSTVEWHLECESIEGLSRQDIINLLSHQITQDDDVDNYYLNVAFWLSIFAIAGCACCTCCPLWIAT